MEVTANRTSGNAGGDTWSASRVSAGDIPVIE